MGSSIRHHEDGTLSEHTATHYYFNHRDATGSLRDEEGAAFASPQQAAAEAAQGVREMISQKLLTGEVIDWQSAIDVVDEAGAVITTVTFLQAAGIPEVRPGSLA